MDEALFSDTPSVLINSRPVMFDPLRPTQQDRNSSRLHDNITKHYHFAQTSAHIIKSQPKRSVYLKSCSQKHKNATELHQTCDFLI